MIRQPIPRRLQLGLGVASVLLLAALYTLISYRQHARNPDDTTIPSWGQLGEGLVKVTTPHPRSGDIWLWEDAKTTFWRLLSGLVVGVVLALLLGLAMGCYTPVESFFLPPLAFLAKVPPTAVLAVFFVMVGTGYEMYVAMIAFGVVPSLGQAIYHAAREDVPDELIYKAQTLGASQAEVIWDVIYKHILPKTLDGIRLQVGPAMVYLIAAEMLVGDIGLGYRIRLQSRVVDMSTVYIYVAFLGAAGYLIDLGLNRFRHWLCPWYGR